MQNVGFLMMQLKLSNIDQLMIYDPKTVLCMIKVNNGSFISGFPIKLKSWKLKLECGFSENKQMHFLFVRFKAEQKHKQLLQQCCEIVLLT